MMTARRKSRVTVPLPNYGDEAPGADHRLCEWPGCNGEGGHRAPRSRDELNTYRWFCLDHIRDYNKAWNYYDGMSDDEVEEDVRRDTVWNRPTWQLGTKLGPDAFDGADDPFNLFRGGGPGQNGTHGDGTGTGADREAGHDHDDNMPPVRPPISEVEERAYRTLDLEYPVSADDIKIRYKSLVKEHHPDANEGAKESEERLKIINEAYAVLRDAINS